MTIRYRRSHLLNGLATAVLTGWAILAIAFFAAPVEAGDVTSLDGPEWLLATDPGNVGRDEEWFLAPPHEVEAKQTRVPWIIQEPFPGYHGVAWYWRDFNVPQHPDPQGRVLLRFWGVDYLAEIWLNGKKVGAHEGGETPFVLDVTDAVKPNAANRLAVRVLNPTHQPIDGIVLNQTPKQARVIPYHAGAAYNAGGITDSVELVLAPAVRVEDVFARADPKTGAIRVVANVRNAGEQPTAGRIEFSVAPAAGGETIRSVSIEQALPVGDTPVEAELNVPDAHFWDLNDPYLYRITARVVVGKADAHSTSEQSVRCGFRDFRFEDGYFRLNGRRLLLRSTHTCNHFPVGLRLPADPDLARRDLINLKTMGFNMIRFIWGGALRYQLDLCDELGLMVYEESFAAWPMEPSPQMDARWDRSISELIRRDRNHPSIVIWGLLNETNDGPQFRRAAASLPMVRALDDSRMVFLNSGRWDLQGTPQSMPPGVDVWRTKAGSEPWIAHNPLTGPVRSHFSFDWSPGQVALHPGPRGEYSVVRFTAPAADRYAIDATFTGLPRYGFNSDATTDVHILHNAKPLFEASLNIDGTPNGAAHRGEIELAKGDTVDFAVGFGNGSHGSDSTALAATLRSSDGKTFNVTAGFSIAENAGRRWTYGMFAPGERSDPATFAPYARSVIGKRPEFGTLANPGSDAWQDVLDDYHNYPRVPHTADTIASLRSANGGENPLFLSEYGIGSAVDLWRVTRHFERIGKTEGEDARFYRERLDRYLADYQRWKLDEMYPRPEDYFAQSVRRMADARTLGLNAIRSNPNIVGYNVTGGNDHVSTGEGLTTTFRELKPGTVDAMVEGWAPLRWCLFAEPVNLYRGSTVRLEAVLADEDALPPGDYPVRIQVVGPGNQRVLDRRLTLNVPARGEDGKEPPFALPVFSEDLKIDGPSGRYRLLATFERGAAPTGGEMHFHVADPADMPPVAAEVVLWGEDPELVTWLAAQGIRTRPFDGSKQPAAREVILAVGPAPADDGSERFAELAHRIARGATVVFLSPNVLARGNQPLGWAPLPASDKGAIANIHSWLYLKDDWAKDHPIFAGLPAGGLMDPVFYREIIPDAVFVGVPAPAEAVAGAIKASQDYASGLTVAVHELGAGRFILNTLRIRENLTTHPAAERLLRNMLNHAARDAAKPLADPSVH